MADTDHAKMFRTLRGFLNGEEPDEVNYFCFSATPCGQRRLHDVNAHATAGTGARRPGIDPRRVTDLGRRCVVAIETHEPRGDWQGQPFRFVLVP
jgi:hypothetical protein